MTTLSLSARSRRRIGARALDALTWLVLLVMLAPIFWLVASSLQDDGELATGAYHLLDPTFSAFTGMWESVDFERYLLNSMVICTGAALLATAFASSAGIACRPARKISIANGSPRQMLGITIAHIVFGPSSHTGRSPSRCV